jgi:hypothetical protein
VRVHLHKIQFNKERYKEEEKFKFLNNNSRFCRIRIRYNKVSNNKIFNSQKIIHQKIEERIRI